MSGRARGADPALGGLDDHLDGRLRILMRDEVADAVELDEPASRNQLRKSAAGADLDEAIVCAVEDHGLR